MSFFNRASNPENFFDITEAKLLRQPEPDYLFARFFLDAVNASLGIPSGFGLDGRQTPTAGAAYVNVDADQLKIAGNLPSELFAVNVNFSALPGQTIRINRPKYIDSTYTLAARQVTSGQVLSTTPINVSEEQVNLTLYRYAGPYDSTAATVKPYAIESFDANMGVHKAVDIVGNNLARDYHKFLDQVNSTLVEVADPLYPEFMTADNDATAVGMFPFTLELLDRAHQKMNERFLPRLADGKRIAVLSSKQCKELFHDPEVKQQSSYHPEFNLLYGAIGYQRTVGMFHIFACDTIQQPLNSSSVAVQHGMALAPGFWMGGMGRKPRVAASTDDNYGEQAKVLWLADLAFGVADKRFAFSLRSA